VTAHLVTAVAVELEARPPGRPLRVVLRDDFEQALVALEERRAVGRQVDEDFAAMHGRRFVYGDEHGAREGLPEVGEMVAGNNGSMYALSISDTLAEEYGGGMGLWISTCLDLRAFTGISFWVRGNAPATTATLTLLMEETTSSTPSTATDAIGTCMGTDDQADLSTCKPPKATFTVTDTWSQVQVPWNIFMPGDSAGTAVPVDGHNIWQIQYDIGVVWADDGTGVYMPTPAPYELVIDDLAFY